MLSMGDGLANRAWLIGVRSFMRRPRRSIDIVLEEVPVEGDLHLLEGLNPSATALDAKMLIEKGAMPALDVFELRNSWYGWWSSRPENSRPFSESTASITAQYLVNGGGPITVERLNGGEQQFIGVEPAQACRLKPSMAVGGQTLRHYLRCRPRKLQIFDLFIGQAELVFGSGLLHPQQSVVLGQQALTLPHQAPAAGGDMDAARHQLLGDPHRTQRMIEDRRFDVRRHRSGAAPGTGRRSSKPSAP